MNIGKNVIIHFGVEIRDAFKVSIGNNSIIGDHVLLDGRNSIEIGENVNISSHASIYTLQHDTQDINFSAKGGKVLVKDRAWVSSNTVVLPNITIEEGCVIASGAVLVKNTEPYSIYGGVPARKISTRNNELKYEFNGKTDWFF